MTGRALVLDLFDVTSKNVADSGKTQLEEATAAARIAGYDSGYKTGWDDAIRQSREEGDRISAEFARNIRDLSFTYFEAQAHVVSSLDTFLEAVVDVYVPALLMETLGPIVSETLSSLAETIANSPIHIRAAPNEAARLRAFLEDDTNLPFQVVEETSLAEGQVYIKMGSQERQVDLQEPLQRLRSAVRALGEVTERTLNERAAG